MQSYLLYTVFVAYDKLSKSIVENQGHHLPMQDWEVKYHMDCSLLYTHCTVLYSGTYDYLWLKASKWKEFKDWTIAPRWYCQLFTSLCSVSYIAIWFDDSAIWLVLLTIGHLVAEKKINYVNKHEQQQHHELSLWRYVHQFMYSFLTHKFFIVRH